MDIDQDSGYIYLAGETRQGANWDILTMKIDPETGDQIWKKKRGQPRGFDKGVVKDHAVDLKIGPNGDIYVLGITAEDDDDYSEENDKGKSDDQVIYLIKFDRDGTLLTETTYDPDKENRQKWNNEIWAKTVAVGNDGELMVGYHE